MNSRLDSDNHYEVLGLEATCNEFDIKKAYRKLAMEYHPDKCRGEIIEADRAFKRIKEAYDILSNPESKQLFDNTEKLNVKYSMFVEKNKCFYDNDTLDQAFNELIKGDYPSIKARRNKHKKEFEEIRWELDSSKPKDSYTQNKKKIIQVKINDRYQNLMVDNFRSKVYVDEHWHKVTKTEHILSKLDTLESEEENEHSEHKFWTATSRKTISKTASNSASSSWTKDDLYLKSAESYAEEQMWENIWKIDIKPGQRLKILTKKVQTLDGKTNIRQKITLI